MKYALGTVQLGMKYGLANAHGQPSNDEAFRILDEAFKSGISTFDVAWAYGTAEDVLGEWVKSRSLQDKVKIISKMKPHVLNDYPDGTPAEEVIRKEVQKSLKRLNVNSLDGYLCHSPYYVYIKNVIDGLQKIKKEGSVKNIGISVYNEPEALQAAELGVDYIQVPYNAFDQRLDKTDFWDTAKKNNVAIFARSPFLQGLLLMKPQDLPDHLGYLRTHLDKFISISKKYGMSPMEAALNFVHKQCRADYVVFGVDTHDQLDEILKIANSISDKSDDEFVKEIQNSFMDLNRDAINPSLWSKIKK